MSGSVSRRSALGVAWTTPVLAASIAVPLASASCASRTYVYRPSDYPGNDSMGPAHNVARITVVTGSHVLVEFVKDYRNATALNIDHKLYGKRDRGYRKGECLEVPLGKCVDPSSIQVDGNNTHYYGGGVFR